MTNVMTGTYTHKTDNGEETFNFDFYTELSTSNKLKFVNSVCDILIDDKNYNYVLRNLLFDFYIIDIFSNIDTSELKSSSFFVNDVEKFLEETNIVDIIKANAKDGLIEELNKAIDVNVEYKTGVHKNDLNDALTSLINTIERKLNEVDLDAMSEMANIFSGMSEDFTPDSIVNAYLKSDAAKKNMEDIEKSKVERAKIAKEVSNVINMPVMQPLT